MLGWAVGQRVRNEAEPSLGLGVVAGFPSTRHISVSFPAAGETRTYNPVTAPLRRFELGLGQTGRTRDGREFKVERIAVDDAGLFTYHAAGLAVPEGDLADASSSHDPLQRLIDGELSDPAAYDLRAACWRLRSDTLRRRSRGLTGARVTLLPHQLAIAHTVASREYPRVLLADEVGLGKTIEACLVYAALRSLGRADRVLVLTPSSLVHQWLIELYRRFQEFFAVADGEAEAPFEGAPRVIAPLDLLQNADVLAQALEQPWDLVIVDEAHHLGWSAARKSPAYAAVEALAARSPGLLLLTATPLRQGLETEFGLLRLVDPDRFADFNRFQAEHAHLRTVADLARRLDAGEDVRAELARLFPEAAWEGTPAELLPKLIDRHGTGRVLIRNRRDKLGGFPGRRLHLTTLPLPHAWEKATAWPEVAALQRMLGLPETPGAAPSFQSDPRGEWVLDLVRELDGAKAVVMASSIAAVKWLEGLFRNRTAFKVAVFHEGLGLVERDRQAAYFADPEGADVLISSEIGGEGRNFQFCQHLVLVDLPVHPDALEQRIGRLDRIGQTGTIQVHVGVVERTPGQALFAWHQRLRVFDAPLTGGDPVLEAQAPRLLKALEAHTPKRTDAAGFAAFLADTEAQMARHRAEVQAGVDFLIDLNSFDPALGQALIAEIEGVDRGFLAACVSGLLEHFGVVEEDMADPRVNRVRPGNHMKVEPFPGLRTDGYLATYDRELALAREDMQFFSPDHPLVEGALSLLLDMAEGRASIALWPEAPEPGVRVEFLFLLEAVGPPRLQLQRFLAPVSLSLTVDPQGKPCEPVPRPLAPLADAMWSRMAGLLQPLLPVLLEDAAAIADDRLAASVDAAVAEARAVLGGEQRRLAELRGLGNVSAAELASHAAKVEETLACLAAARVSLDAVRVVVLQP